MPYSQITINLTEHAIDVESASSLPSIGCGGECIFVGRTRPESHKIHGDLLLLQYECYREMAEIELQLCAREAIEQFSIRYVSVTHSVGKVAVGEASVVVAVSSDHRTDAFAACQFIIDVLKERVPIWKQELWADGTTWKEGNHLQQQ